MKSFSNFVFFALLLVLAVLGFAAWWLRPQIPSAQDSLVAHDEEFVRLVQSVLPSVVSIDAQALPANDARSVWLRMFGGNNATPSTQIGAGVIVSADGYIVTNHHVIQGASALRVYLNNSDVVEARLVGSDPASDIAILKIHREGLQPLAFGNSDQVRVAQRVFAVGNPFGLQETITQGIISAKDRRATSEAANEFFQTDAAVNAGNSGGPLVDMRGQLIGITSLVRPEGRGIAFAIPSNTVLRVFQNIRDHGRFIRPWFGAVGQAITPAIAQQLGLSDTLGTVIVGTYEGSPAHLAGLLPGDVIIAYNGKPVGDVLALRNRIVETPIGGKVTLTIIRGGKKTTLDTTIAAEPYPPTS